MTCLLAGFAGLFVRLVWLQVADHDLWVQRAAANQLTRVAIPAERGAILDRCGRPLAVSHTAWSVGADPMIIADKALTAGILARALSVDADALRERLVRPKRFVWLKRHISAREADWVRRLELDGIELRRESERSYPQGSLAAHILGFVDIDNEGLAGVEAQFDALIRGVDGVAVVRRDGRRQHILDATTPQTQPVHGKTLILTIDSAIQGIAEQELAAAVAKFAPEAAVAIVLEPYSGDVLALANWPTYDANRFSQTREAVLRNRAIADWFEPGSTFKPFIAAGVLDAGLTTPASSYDCHNGAWRVGGRTLHDAHGYGQLTFVEVIEKSSNIGIAQIGMLLNNQGMHRVVRNFGFGQRTAIELPGEAEGLLRPAAEWSKYSITSIPIGQEIAVSALQLAAGFAVLANGGMRVPPRLALGWAAHEGSVVEQRFERRPPERVLSATVADYMARTILTGVVENGTGKNARLEGYTVGGKTGTAQVARAGGRGYETGAYIGTFVGFAPVEAPRFVVLVSLIKPRKAAYYGGTVAAPAVARILDRALTYVGVPRRYVETAMR